MVRPTRAHPGASPLRSLDDLKPVRKTRKTARKVQNKVAIVAPALSHEDATTASRHQSPPTITSPSQSPQPESGSQSPLAPESSGSTSPPAISYTRPQTRRENSKEQNQRAKRAGPIRAASKGSKKRPRVDEGPSTHPGVATSGEDTDSEQRPAKRARNNSGSYTPKKDESRKQKKSPLPAAGNSSANTTPIGQQLAKYTPSQSTSNQTPHAASPRPEDTRPSPLSPFHLARKGPFLLARSLRQGQSGEEELVPDDLAERERLYQERFNCPMPQPLNNPKVFNRFVEESFIEDEQDEESDAEDLDNNTNDPNIFGRNSISNNSLQSTDYLESAHSGRKTGARASSSRPSTKPSNFSTPPKSTRVVPPRILSTQVVIPATRSEQELVLTRPNIIDLVRAIATWAEQDNSRHVPPPKEMVAYLESYNTQKNGNAATETTTSTPPQPLQRVSEAPASHKPHSAQSSRRRNSDYYSMLNGENVDESAIAEDESEVQASPPEPKTPASQSAPHAQESRAWWSGVSAVKNILKTPFNYFGGRLNSPAPDAVTTNGEPVTALPIPQTSDFSRPPSTPTPLLGRAKAAAQSERRRRVQTPQKGRSSTLLPQSERRPRRGDNPKPPIHLRGLVSAERIAEIHREQDLLAEARQKHRSHHATRAEEEEELAANQSFHPSRVGEKRKRITSQCPPGTYRFPSSDSSSDDSSESDGEVEPNKAEALSQATRPSPQVSFTEEELHGRYPQDLDAYEKRFYVMHGEYPREGNAIDFFCMIDAKWQTNIYQNISERKNPKNQWTAEKRSTPEEIAAMHARIRRSYINPFATFEPPNKASASHKSPTSYSGSTSRNGPGSYTGYLFRQPAAVQANIDEGLYPIAPRLSSSRKNSTPNIFDAERQLTAAEVFLKDVEEAAAAAKYANLQKSQRPSSDLFNKSTSNQQKPQSPSLLDRVSVPKGDSRTDRFGKPASTSNKPKPQSPSLFDKVAAPKGDSRTDLFGKPASTSNKPKPQSPSLFDKVAAPKGDSRTDLFGKPASTSNQPNPQSPSLFSTTPTIPSSANLFGKATPSSSNAQTSSLLDRVTVSEGHSHQAAISKPDAFTNSFQVPGSSESDSDDDDDVSQGSEKGKGKEHEAEQNGQTANETVLQEKQWTQTPPPKPRPGNAQLPQQPTQPTAADIAKSKANPFAPKQPSRLRNVTQMSPLQLEQENRAQEAQTRLEQAGARQDMPQTESPRQPRVEKDPHITHLQQLVRDDLEWFEGVLDPEVMAYLKSIDDTIPAMEIPYNFDEERSGLSIDLESENEVFRLLP